MPQSWSWLEQTAGALIVASILIDIFLTVLFARMGYSIFADVVARIVWKTVFIVSRPFGSHRRLMLSFGGPIIVVVAVAFWLGGVILGMALIFHPALGKAIQSSDGAVPTGFPGAVFAAGASVVMLGASSLHPGTTGFRCIYLFNAVIGMSLVTLTITYVVEIYNALHDRNTLGVKLYLMTRRTGDAAELICGLALASDADAAYSTFAEIAAEVLSVRESHNFYPVLFYFRFQDAYYSVSMCATISLDACSLLTTALENSRYGWLQSSAPVFAVREGALLLVNTLQNTFVGDIRPHGEMDEEQTVRCWRKRYFAAVRRFRDAGLAIRPDEEAGAREYVAMRRDWDRYIRTLAPANGYDLNQIDPALSKACPEAATARR